MLPAERRKFILERLAEQGRVTVAELSQNLGVSPMTIHRDLNALAGQGLLRKVRGGAMLPLDVGRAVSTCPVCAGRPSARTRMTLHLTDGSSWQACCPHCGLWALAVHCQQVVAAVVPDFLTGHVVNASRATFLVGPDISLCCTPTVLAFEHRRDAERFQKGFGGEITSFEEATALLQTLMAPGTRKTHACASHESPVEAETNAADRRRRA